MIEQPKHQCPQCYGAGIIFHEPQHYLDHSSIARTCEFCLGKGEFDEDDYLVLKLEGYV